MGWSLLQRRGPSLSQILQGAPGGLQGWTLAPAVLGQDHRLRTSREAPFTWNTTFSLLQAYQGPRPFPLFLGLPSWSRSLLAGVSISQQF